MASSSIIQEGLEVDNHGEEEEHIIPTDQNVLQKHVGFFDRNHDGIIYPWETFKGFRAIGCSYALSMVGGFIINVAFSGKTRPGKFPSLLFPIEVKNVLFAKHGSDTGAFDSQGRFVPSKFEEIFSKYAQTDPNGLTLDELKKMLKTNREPKDYGAWFAETTEWRLLYSLCKDKNGLLPKEKVKGVYDGSIFEILEKENNSKKIKA